MIDQTIRDAAQRFLEAGAVMSVFLEGDWKPLEMPISEFQWLDDNTVYFFERGGENEFHGHTLEFDAARMPHDLAIVFNVKGKLTGYLTKEEE